MASIAKAADTRKRTRKPAGTITLVQTIEDGPLDEELPPIVADDRAPYSAADLDWASEMLNQPTGDEIELDRAIASISATLARAGYSVAARAAIIEHVRAYRTAECLEAVLNDRERRLIESALPTDPAWSDPLYAMDRYGVTDADVIAATGCCG